MKVNLGEGPSHITYSLINDNEPDDAYVEEDDHDEYNDNEASTLHHRARRFEKFN